MVLVLDDAAVDAVLDLPELSGVVEHALVRQGRSEVERPERPHYPVGEGLDGDDGDGSGRDGPLGTALAMPAYVHGGDYFATKLVSVHDDNPERGLPTMHAQVVLADARTGQPAAFLDGTRITNARTGCIGGLAARDLAEDPLTVGVLGAGAQARWQTRAVDALCEVDAVRVYSPSDSKAVCASDLREEGVDAAAVESPRAAVAGADVVVTATTSTEPVFPADALAGGALVVAVGAYTAEMQEVPPAVFERADRVFADVPEEAAEVGDLLATDLDAGDITPLSAVFEGEAGRGSDEDLLVVKSVGTAVLDVAAASEVYEAAAAAGLGTEQEL